MGDVGGLPAEGPALLRAVLQGKLRLTRLLLEGGAYINEGNARGETPLAAACSAPYGDGRARRRMVSYLLQQGADPNIPDKTGRTALMHACAAAAGEDVVALLLRGGADPRLRDYAGCSALVHAVNEGDRGTLRALLDACRDRGQEVIIITTDSTKNTKQYLNAPPSPAPACEGGALRSPSDVQLGPAPAFSFTPAPGSGFGLGSGSGLGDPDPPGGQGHSPSPNPPPAEKRPPPRKLLKRLNSEPWGLLAPSAGAPQEGGGLEGGGPQEGGGLEGGGPLEGGALEGGGLCRMVAELRGLSVSAPPRPLLSRRHSIETHEPTAPKPSERCCWEAPEAPGGARGLGLAPPRPARLEPCEWDGPRSIPGSPDSGRLSAERRRLAAPPPALAAPGELQEAPPGPASPPSVRRRPPGLLERRGSGTLLLDRLSHSRPGFLPPLNLNPHRPIPDIRANGKPPSPSPAPPHAAPPSPVHAALKGRVPVAPASPKRGPDFKTKKKLLRRHSMQLCSFQD